MSRGKRLLFMTVFLTLSLGASLSFSQQDTALVCPKVREQLLTELSGEIAREHVIHISRFDRIQASAGWHQAALYIMEQLKRYGISDARIEGWPSNGEIKYFTWTTPVGWEAEFGELWVEEPQRMRLASYEELPTTLVKHSVSHDVTAELVDVGSGLRPEDYEGVDVKGKIVLATGYTGDVHRQAVIKRGALGVITYLSPDSRRYYPELVQYTALWPRWSERDKIGFGFNISREQSSLLQRWLGQKKKVLLHAQVKGKIYESKIEMMSAVIPGTTFPEQEVLICGHLDHYKPGANDNASGSAGMLEIARALQRLISQGQLPPPRRTIRFLWVSEMYGTIAYLKNHPEVSQRTIANINLDMIGEDSVKTNSYFYVTRTPDSNPSFLNDLVENMVIHTSGVNITSPRGSRFPFNYRISPYGGGSDHYMFTEGSIGVPATMFGHPDPYHHTIQDTVDKVDSTELKRVCYIAACCAWWMANASDEEALSLANEVAKRGLGRAGLDLCRAMRAMDDSTASPEELYTAYKEGVNVVKHAFYRELSALRSVLLFVEKEPARGYIRLLEENLGANQRFFLREVEDYYGLLCQRLGCQVRKITLTDEEKRAARLIVVRSEEFKGPLDSGYLAEKLGDETIEEKLPLRGNIAYETINFIDGKRNLLEIRNAVSGEYRPVELKAVEEYLRMLEKAGLVRIEERR